jgi:hypothetical protein
MDQRFESRWVQTVLIVRCECCDVGSLVSDTTLHSSSVDGRGWVGNGFTKQRLGDYFDEEWESPLLLASTQ